MNILIIEDEKRNFNRLKRLLEEMDGTPYLHLSFLRPHTTSMPFKPSSITASIIC